LVEIGPITQYIIDISNMISIFCEYISTYGSNIDTVSNRT